jgi:N-hydroxyarylamine O-acetyltransferase
MSFDLTAYLARIGFHGDRPPTRATLDAIARGHATTIPFENLDVLWGRPIAIGPEALMRKLVHEKRGGYCFEQNNLMLHALRAIGFRVTPLGARVRWQIPRDVMPARTHLFLQVHLPDGDYLVDVGLGGSSLPGTIPFRFGEELETSHEPRRLTNDGGRMFHQMWNGTEWTDVCEFSLEEMHPIDCEVANWYTSANPSSHFRQKLVVGRANADGTRCAIRDGVFTHRRGGEIIESRELRSAAELLELLARRFDLHFPPGTRFGPPGAPWEK